MPRGKKRAASPPPIHEVDARSSERADDQDETMDIGAEEVEEGSGVQRLEFNEPLTWRAGKGIPINDLLRRLRTLCDELQSIDQIPPEDEISRQSFAPKAQELANTLLLNHRDRGIQAHALLCIVEMIRILAPHAPFTTTQLKNIFNVFVSTTLPALATPSDPYNALNHSILDSLSTFQSIVLISDIPGSERLILTLFTTVFDILSNNVRDGSGDQISKNVEHHMGQLLITLVNQDGSLPHGVVDVILAQFFRADVDASVGKPKNGIQTAATQDVSSAYHMAQNICISADAMVRYVGNYFNAVLIDATEATATIKNGKSKNKRRNFDDSIDEDDTTLLTAPSEEDLQEIEKAHKLLRELWRSCPDVIRNAVPQLEAELGGENQHFRLVAVQAIGDMIAGVGAAGFSSRGNLDPVAYPSPSSSGYSKPVEQTSVLLQPNAPYAFSSIYPQTYQLFMERWHDKTPAVRCAWTTAVGRIIATAGGGKGLDAEQEAALVEQFSDMLVDQDEKVRLSAIQSIAQLDYSTIVEKLGKYGGIGDKGSVLSNLADRAADAKPSVHTAAIELLGRIWGVASGAIMEENESIRKLFGEIPSHIMEAMYKNIPSINAVVPQVLYESLLPIGFPPIKAKTTSSDTQRTTNDETSLDPDLIRVQRILTLLQGMSERAQKVFSQLQHRSKPRSAFLESIIKNCEVANGSSDGDPKVAKQQISKLVDALAKMLPNSELMSGHLRNFFAHYDRRNFFLVRLCYDSDSGYKRIVNAMKEIKKRLEDSSNEMAATSDAVACMLRSASPLIYNKSHVPAIMAFARSDQGGLGPAANEVLKDISSNTPSVFKACVQELCETLKNQAPDATTPNDPGAVDALKACAGFSRKFPRELDANRAFFNAMAKMAMYGMPPAAAKHAVTILVTSAEKKDMYIDDVMKYCVTKFEFGSAHFLSKLAALGQLRLLANVETEDEEEAVTEIAASKVLMQSRMTASTTDPDWDEQMDEDITAKLLALRVLVNGLRGRVSQGETIRPDKTLTEASTPIFKLLNTLVEQEGELVQDGEGLTPKHHKSRLRLAAAKLVLKLCCHKALDTLFLPPDFNRLIKIVQDPVPQVRAGFNGALKKYLGRNKLQTRFYGLVFLYAFEPAKTLKENTVTWIRARALTYAQSSSRIMESIFPRFINLLAHHDDFGRESEDLKDFVQYILFYLNNVATESNLAFIYKNAQAIKGLEDRIDPAKSENLYTLSDLSEAVIRCFQEVRGWSLQILPDQPSLPKSLYTRISDAATAQKVAETRYIPEDLADELEDMVKNNMRSKKRKSDAPVNRGAKRAKQTASVSAKSTSDYKAARPPKKATKASRKRDVEALAAGDRRKSARVHRSHNYVENDDSEDDEELEQWQATSDVEAEANKENLESSTPPTSEPVQTTIDESSTTKRAARATRATALPTRATRGKAARKTRAATEQSSDEDEALE